MYKHINSAGTDLAAGLAQGATTATVTDANKLPSTFPYLLQLWDAGTYANPNADTGREIVEVTAATGNALTVVRAKDGTSDQAHSAGEKATNSLVALTLECFLGRTPDATLGNVVQPAAADVVPLTLKGAASQTANLIEVQSSAGTVLLAVQADGDLAITGGVDVVLSATTGTQFGTATTQLLALWGATPTVQQAAITAVNEAYTTGNLDTEAEIIAALNTQGAALNDALAALRALGLIAS